MPSSTSLTIEDMSHACDVDTDFIRELTQRKILKPVLSDGTVRYSSKDRLTIEIIMKGLDLDFSMNELEALIGDRSRMNS